MNLFSGNELKFGLIVLCSLALFLLVAGCRESSGNAIYFVSDRDGSLEIYKVHVSGSAEKNVTQSPANESEPIVSSNGQLIAFLSETEGDVTLEVMKSNDTVRHKISSPKPGKVYSHCWSPDGNRIAYIKEEDNKHYLYVSNSDGSGTMLLTAISGDEIGGWSPDGNSVVFTVRDGSGRGLYIRNPDGVNEFRLTDNLDFNPVWSPNSQKIAFLSHRDGNDEIYLMDVGTADVQRITQTEASEYGLKWSPDGKKLVFVSERDGNPEIYAVDMVKGLETRLTFNDIRDDEPTWSPDGRQIAFVSYMDGDAEIFVMREDGTSQYRLTNNTAQDVNPSW